MRELKRILFAEDSENDIELTLAAFTEHRLANEVVVVRDGVEALDYLYRRGPFRSRPDGNPAVLLLDLKMPKIDGLEVLRTLRSEESLRSIPVVILTSSREQRDLIESYELGANAYVVKPVRFQQFSEAVKTLGLFWGVLNQPPPGAVGGGATTPGARGAP